MTKLAVVTGARRGIGKAIFEALARDHTVVPFQGDVRSLYAWDRSPDADILVNAAGIPSSATLLDEDMEKFREVLDVNLFGPMLGMRRMIPGMIERGHGVIVNITSVYAHDPGIGQAAAYHASKAALSMLTRNAARKYRTLRIIEVACGFTDTRMTEPYHDNPRYEQYVNDRTLMRRLGRPEEIAAAVRFLVSDEASFITGSAMRVDGGWTG